MKEKTIGCRHFPACSGCVYDSCEEPPALYTQAKEFFATSFGTSLSFVQGDVRKWRVRAKLAVRKPQSVGLFEKGTHHVLAIPSCQVHHPKINQAVSRFLAAFQQSTLTAYDETSKTGDIRYIQCVVERESEKVQLTLVCNSASVSAKCVEFAEKLFDATIWHSIWINCNDTPTNTIFGKAWQKIAGDDELWESIGGLEVAFGPSHFGQANLAMYEQLVTDICQNVTPNRQAVELYAGIGAIGLNLAKTCQSVLLCEVEPHARIYFDKAFAKLCLTLQKRLCYHIAKAEECLNFLHDASLCIVDPPRKGLGEAILRRILTTASIQELVYVSCDWHSLERDLRYMKLNFPEWRVKKAISYLFFPGTNQIETVAFLEKKESG